MKNIKKINFLFLFFISVALFSFTKDTEKSVEIDISESLPKDFDTSNLKFIWNMGDSLVEQGLAFKHVYSKPGKYRISMAIKYIDLDITSRDEFVFDLYVK